MRLDIQENRLYFHALGFTNGYVECYIMVHNKFQVSVPRQKAKTIRTPVNCSGEYSAGIADKDFVDHFSLIYSTA